MMCANEFPELSQAGLARGSNRAEPTVAMAPATAGNSTRPLGLKLKSRNLDTYKGPLPGRR